MHTISRYLKEWGWIRAKISRASLKYRFKLYTASDKKQVSCGGSTHAEICRMLPTQGSNISNRQPQLQERIFAVGVWNTSLLKAYLASETTIFVNFWKTRLRKGLWFSCFFTIQSGISEGRQLWHLTLCLYHLQSHMKPTHSWHLKLSSAVTITLMHGQFWSKQTIFTQLRPRILRFQA